MFTLIQHFGLRQSLANEAVPLGLSLLIAEFLFKFHSFNLECLAFLATWFGISYLYSLVKSTLSVNRRTTA